MQADVSASPKELRGSVVRKRGRTLGRKRYRRLLAGSIVLLATGAMFSVAGVIELQREILLSANGVPALGRVAEFATPKWTYGGALVDLELLPSEASPRRTRIEHAWFIRDLHAGTTLRLICTEPSSQSTKCEVDTLVGRWLEPIVLLIIGLPALLIGWLWLPRGDTAWTQSARVKSSIEF